jgi:hypothetical protein
MTDADLDLSYTAVCEALAEVGPQRSELFLSMLCLSLMARFPVASDVLPLISSVRAQCDAEVDRDSAHPSPG